jgi:hypothetical protein
MVPWAYVQLSLFLAVFSHHEGRIFDSSLSQTCFARGRRRAGATWSSEEGFWLDRASLVVDYQVPGINKSMKIIQNSRLSVFFRS